MKCSICNKNIQTFIKCEYCNNICCNEKCISVHMLKLHKNIINNIKMHSKQNTSPNIGKYNMNNSSNFNNLYAFNLRNRQMNMYSRNNNTEYSSSPYITPGFLLPDLEFDPKYLLKNFLLVTQNGKPRVIGEGSLAKVYVGLNTIDNKYYAVKHMLKSEIEGSLNTREGIEREMQYQSRICHQNIIRLLNVQQTDQSYYYVMEYGDSGTLFTYIRIRNHLKEEEAFKFFIQIANAIYFLHSNDFIHRDLKPENILVFGGETVKLADFGWCCNLAEFEGARTTFCGTVEYMSPEIVGQKNYTKEIDIWSMGILLYEMLHGFSPFSSPDTGDDENHIIANIKHHNLAFADYIDKSARELICKMLDPNPSKRIKIVDIFSSDFVKKYEKAGFGIPKVVKFEPYAWKKNKDNNKIQKLCKENELN